MLFAGKRRQMPDRPHEEKGLYPVLHVADSLKSYQKELVRKEVASLSELSMVGASFRACCRRRIIFRKSFRAWESLFLILTRRRNSLFRCGVKLRRPCRRPRVRWTIWGRPLCGCSSPTRR